MRARARGRHLRDDVLQAYMYIISHEVPRVPMSDDVSC
eukprot:COSAG02_NODE_35449_length_468_cov_0.823848_2_plen_37_part_01